MQNVQTQTRLPDDLPTVSELIEQGVERNNPGKSQAELAREIGFLKNQASMLSMIKKGTSRLKLGRVARTAKVLKLDPVVLLAASLREKTNDEPEAWALIKEVINGTHTEQEGLVLDVIRAIEHERGQKLYMTPEKIALLKKFAESQLFVD